MINNRLAREPISTLDTAIPGVKEILAIGYQEHDQTCQAREEFEYDKL